MKVAYAMLCEYASATMGGKLNILAIFDIFTGPAVPFDHPGCFLILALRGDKSEAGQTRQLRVRLMGPNGNNVLETGLAIPVPEPKSGLFQYQLLQVIQLPRIRFEAFGGHKFIVYLDEKISDELDCHVVPFQTSGPFPSASST